MTVFRIEVSPTNGSADPRGEAALHQAEQAGFSPTSINTTSVFLVEGELDEERKNLESKIEDRTKELKVAQEEAEAASQSKGDFLANMSHEAHR